MKKTVLSIVLLLVTFSSGVNPIKMIAFLEGSLSSDVVSDDLVLSQLETVINQSQTWYGDFVVGATDTVIIENCNFTVLEGSILVHGILDIENCSILIQHETTLQNPEIYVYPNALLNVYNSSMALRGRGLSDHVSIRGNLSFCDSELLGYVIMFASFESHVFIRDSAVSVLFVNGASSVVVNGSTLDQITMDYAGGKAEILNSEVFVTYILRAPPNYGGPLESYFYESNLTEVKLSFQLLQNPANLSLRKGQVDNLTISNHNEGYNLTFTDCVIGKWGVSGQNLILHDSSIERIGFSVDSMEQLNLTLENGLIESKHIFVENSVNITVTNSEVDEWYVGVNGGNIRISDSCTWVSVRSNAIVEITNSTLPFASITATAQNASLHVMNSTANGVWLWYLDSAVDLVLYDGYHNLSTFVNEASGSNLTIERTFVEHWSIGAFGNSTLHLHNSTISSPPRNPDYTHWSRFGGENATIYFHNSTVNGSAICQDSASFTLINSSLHELWAVEDCNITLVNSTIDVLITDPPEINLINSKIYAEIRFSYATSLACTVSIMDTPPVPLPPNVHSVGKYLHVEGSRYDYNEIQVRIYFDEDNLAILGISESSLTMFFLEESSDNWQICPIQGTNSSENYVWANVTHFSYFTIGGYLLGDVNLDGLVDIFDLFTVCEAYGSVEGEPGYTPEADVNKDGVVGTQDLTVVCTQYGEDP